MATGTYCTCNINIQTANRIYYYILANLPPIRINDLFAYHIQQHKIIQKMIDEFRMIIYYCVIIVQIKYSDECVKK